MTYSALLKSISKPGHVPDNDRFIKKFLTQVMKATWRDSRFEIPKFLVLTVRTTKARTIRNPITKELMQLSKKETVKARVCKEWRSR